MNTGIGKRTIESYKAYLSSIDRKTPIKVSVEKKLGSYSTNRFLSSLRSYFRYLIKMDYPSPIPPDAITLIKKEKKVPKVPEFQDTVKLIESPSQLEKNQLVAKRNRAVLEVFFSTGMRISELVNLKLNQI